MDDSTTERVWRKAHSITGEELQRLHWELEMPVKAIAEHFRVSRDTITKRMDFFGVRRRSIGEDNLRRYSTMSPEEIREQTRSANRERRGSVVTPEQLRTRAKSSEGKIEQASKWERLFYDALPEHVRDVFVYNYALDKFNIDFAVPQLKLAVEIHGGNWHTAPRKKKQDTEKRSFLEKENWTLLEIWSKDLLRDVDNIIALLKLPGGNPTSGS